MSRSGNHSHDVRDLGWQEDRSRDVRDPSGQGHQSRDVREANSPGPAQPDPNSHGHRSRDVREANSPGPAKPDPHTLAIETSCDDTCAAVIAGSGDVRSNIVASQLDHDRFGGVVPEVAARAHLTQIAPVISLALRDAGVTLDEVDRIAVTAGPGLTGALVIGMAAAKAIALSRGLPLHAIDHLHGHICANSLGPDAIDPPFVCLIASGGHSFVAAVEGYERERITVLGRTLDDAAGEAIDKGARMLGLPFPGGPALQALAAGGDPAAFALPVAAGVAGLDFSFAGLKTALLYTIRDLGEQDLAARRADLAASFQEAVVAQLARRTERALAETGMRRLALGGGVAANGPLRERLSRLATEFHAPAREYCTDNAAMIAAAACFSPAATEAATLDVYPTGTVSL